MGFGRPAMYETPEEMGDAMEKYFTDTPMVEWTITGLALALGFVSRQSFYDHEVKPDFTYIIKKARLKVEQSYETTLRSRDLNATGSIFALKNMGWKDKQEIETSGTTTQLLKFIDDDRDAEIN